MIIIQGLFNFEFCMPWDNTLNLKMTCLPMHGMAGPWLSDRVIFHKKKLT